MTNNNFCCLNEFRQTPQWMHGGSHLKTGYRKSHGTFKEYARSLFRMHNETLNIWTHLLGAIFFIVCGMILSSILLPNDKFQSIVSLKHKHSIRSKAITDKVVEFQIMMKKKVEFEDNQTYSGLVLHLKVLEQEISDYSTHIASKIKKEGHLISQRIRKNTKFIGQLFNRYHTILTVESERTKDTIEHQIQTIEKCITSGMIEKLLQPLPDQLETYPILIFLIGAIACLGLSTVFHWFHPMNETVCKILLKLDYSGITLLNFGSSFAVFYYYFYCNPLLFYFSAGFIFLACLVVFLVSLTNWIDQPKNNTFKGLMYAALGASNLIPLSFLIGMVVNAADHNDHISIGFEFFLIWGTCLTYALGLVFYLLKFPEKFFPVKFDIWFNSHTIWHLLVFAAAVENFLLLIYLYDKRRHSDCLSC